MAARALGLLGLSLGLLGCGPRATTPGLGARSSGSDAAPGAEGGPPPAAGCRPPADGRPLAAPVPSDWRRYRNQAFTFMAPPELTELPVHGIDSYVGQYAGPVWRLGFDVGMYSDDSLGGHRGASGRGALWCDAVTIAGRRGVVGAWQDDPAAVAADDGSAPRRHGCATYLPGAAGDHLAVWIESSEPDTAACLAILSSIELVSPPPW